MRKKTSAEIERKPDAMGASGGLHAVDSVRGAATRSARAARAASGIRPEFGYRPHGAGTYDKAGPRGRFIAVPIFAGTCGRRQGLHSGLRRIRRLSHYRLLSAKRVVQYAPAQQRRGDAANGARTGNFSATVL